MCIRDSGHPDEERHVKLIIRRYGRSVEEQMAGIVENILTMIGSVEHGGIYLLFSNMWIRRDKKPSV